MELFLAILLCIIFAAISVFGGIYLDMDKHKSRAIVYIDKLKPDFTKWVEITVELAEKFGDDKEKIGQIKALAESYRKCKKYRDRLDIIGIVNQMFLVNEELFYNRTSDEFAALKKERDSLAVSLFLFSDQINATVTTLNKKINRGLSSKIAAITHLNPVEELMDLTR